MIEVERENEGPEDVEDLLELGVAGEEGLVGEELDEDAGDGPDVDTSGVVGGVPVGGGRRETVDWWWW